MKRGGYLVIKCWQRVWRGETVGAGKFLEIQSSLYGNHPIQNAQGEVHLFMNRGQNYTTT